MALSKTDKQIILGISISTVVIVGIIMGFIVGWPIYKVWEQEKKGEAEFKRAEQNRKIKIEEAKAELESADALAQAAIRRAKGAATAEIERAKGVAEANRIIGGSLQDNEAYLRYLWIQGLHDGNSEVIYVPTETNLPILEAGRFGKTRPAVQ